jgi:hypothetical protein
VAKSAKKNTRPRPPADKSFDFRDAVRILRPTGKKAETLRELRDLLATANDECIFHHTYQYFSKGHILEYTNDFAQWAAENLEESALSEMLSSIDPYSYPTVEALRGELLRVIDYYIGNFPETRTVMPGDEFYFIETISFIFPVGVKARNLAEFLMALKYIDAESIYYHFFEARMRLGQAVDDFSKWLADVLDMKDMAEKIQSIDPFMHNMEGIREHLIEIIEEGLKEQMGAAT